MLIVFFLPCNNLNGPLSICHMSCPLVTQRVYTFILHHSPHIVFTWKHEINHTRHLVTNFLSFFSQTKKTISWGQATKKNWGQPYQMANQNLHSGICTSCMGPNRHWPLTTWLLMGIITCVLYSTLHSKIESDCQFVFVFIYTSP